MKRNERARLVRALALVHLHAFEDAFDAGILRVFEPSFAATSERGRLVGIIVIRDGSVTYAELDGRVHSFGRCIRHRDALALLVDQILRRKLT